MFKKVLIVALFAVLAGAFSLNAAPSKQEVQKMFKTMIKKEWHKRFFVPQVFHKKSFAGDECDIFIFEEYTAFVPEKIVESKDTLTVIGCFEDEDGLEDCDNIYKFVFVKSSGKWLISKIYHMDDSKKVKKVSEYNFTTGKMQVLPNVSKLD